MLSCQVNIYCENLAIFVILCHHVMKIIWLSRQVEWHLYASIVVFIKGPHLKVWKSIGLRYDPDSGTSHH